MQQGFVRASLVGGCMVLGQLCCVWSLSRSHTREGLHWHRAPRAGKCPSASPASPSPVAEPDSLFIHWHQNCLCSVTCIMETALKANSFLHLLVYQGNFIRSCLQNFFIAIYYAKQKCLDRMGMKGFGIIRNIFSRQYYLQKNKII